MNIKQPFMGLAKRQKYELTIFTLSLVFVLGILGCIKNEILANTILGIFITAISGNVLSKVPKIWSNKDEEVNSGNDAT
jgi:hypothetical protein